MFFWPNLAVFDIVGKTNFYKNKVWKFKEVLIGSWSYLVLDQLQKIVAPRSMQARRL
jgi:hypothetical protein